MTKGMPIKAMGLRTHICQLESTAGCCEKRHMKVSSRPAAPCTSRSRTSQSQKMRFVHTSRSRMRRQRQANEKIMVRSEKFKKLSSADWLLLFLTLNSSLFTIISLLFTSGLMSPRGVQMKAPSKACIRFSGTNMAARADRMVSTPAPSRRSLPSCAHGWSAV